jgi:hypothetical protein
MSMRRLNKSSVWIVNIINRERDTTDTYYVLDEGSSFRPSLTSFDTCHFLSQIFTEARFKITLPRRLVTERPHRRYFCLSRLISFCAGRVRHIEGTC